MNFKQKQHKSRAAVALFLLLFSSHHDCSHAFATPTLHVSSTGTVLNPLSSQTFHSRLWESSNEYDPSFDDTSMMLAKSMIPFKDHDSRISTKKSTEPIPALILGAKNMFDTMKNINKYQATIAAMSALAVTLAMSPLPADAAMSGGRMGGSYSSPSRSMSRPSYTRTAPSRSTGGYSQGLGSGFAAGYGAGALSRPSFVTPFYSPFSTFPQPYYSPGYIGGPGIITYNRGPSILPLLLFAGVAFALNSATSRVSDGLDGFSPTSLLGQTTTSALGSGTSVLQVTVAMEVSDRDDRNSILSVLNGLANTARTDSRVGIQNLTSQGTLLEIGPW